MILDTSTKAFWIGAFFVLIALDGIMAIIAGLTNTPRSSSNYTLATAADGVLMLIVAVGYMVAA